MKHSGQHDSPLMLFAVVVAVLSLAGCSSDADKVRVLQKEKAKLQQENDDLNSRITDLQGENKQLQTSNLALANMNGSLANKGGVMPARNIPLDGEKSDLDKKNQEIPNFAHYDGVWQCEKGDDTDSSPSYRVLTSDSWALLTFNKTTNELVMGKVGTYVVRDGIYQETVTLPAPADKDSVNQFVIDADGNGMSNGSEHWIRSSLQ